MVPAELSKKNAWNLLEYNKTTEEMATGPSKQKKEYVQHT